MSEASPVEDVTEAMIRQSLAKGWRLRYRGGWWEVIDPEGTIRGTGTTSIGALCSAVDRLWCVIAGALR